MERQDDTKEFLGKFGISYMENNLIWAYDEISMGVYEIDVNTRKVNVILTPMQVHRNNILRIRGIIKRNNEIIVVPQFVDEGWIVYELKCRKVTYIYPISLHYQIVEVRQIDNIIYLLPLNTNQPILIVSLVDMRCIKQINDWYCFTDDNHPCWGTSCNQNGVFFPVIGSNYICKVNLDKVELLMINVTDQILSVSAGQDDLWILPIERNCIYQSDMNGNLMERIDLTKETELLDDWFARIVSTESCIFLFPQKSNSIYIYMKLEKRIKKIDSQIIPYWRELLYTSCSYWDYHIYKGMVYILPMKYRYILIDLSTMKKVEKEMVYGENLQDNDYWEWCLEIRRKILIYQEKKDTFLEDFIQFVKYISRMKHSKDEKFKGEKIWKCCKQHFFKENKQIEFMEK